MEARVRGVPLVLIGGAKKSWRSGAADDFASFPDGVEMAEGERLDQNVAGRGGFGRPGENGEVDGIGGELIEQIVVAAAANDVETFHFISCNDGDLVERASVKQCEAFESAADEGAFVRGDGVIGSAAEFGDLCGHVLGSKKFFRGRIDERSEWR